MSMARPTCLARSPSAPFTLLDGMILVAATAERIRPGRMRSRGSSRPRAGWMRRTSSARCHGRPGAIRRRPSSAMLMVMPALRRHLRPDPPRASDPGRGLPRGLRAGPGLVRGRRGAVGRTSRGGRTDAALRIGRGDGGSPPGRRRQPLAFEVSEIETRAGPGPHYSSVETLAAVARERPEERGCSS